MPGEYPHGRALSAITTRLVQLHARYYGRGPTKARTYIADDLVVCLLRDGLTPVERELARIGDDQTVEQSRRAFQQTVESEFRGVIEEETGREVIAYMHSMTAEPEIVAEIFMLADGESSAELG